MFSPPYRTYFGLRRLAEVVIALFRPAKESPPGRFTGDSGGVARVGAITTEPALRQGRPPGITQGNAPWYVSVMARRFMVVPEHEGPGGFSVTVPDLPGCVSQGETEAEALANIREAIEGYIEGMKADGLPIPEPHTSIATVEVKAA